MDMTTPFPGDGNVPMNHEDFAQFSGFTVSAAIAPFCRDNVRRQGISNNKRPADQNRNMNQALSRENPAPNSTTHSTLEVSTDKHLDSSSNNVRALQAGDAPESFNFNPSSSGKAAPSRDAPESWSISADATLADIVRNSGEIPNNYNEWGLFWNQIVEKLKKVGVCKAVYDCQTRWRYLKRIGTNDNPKSSTEAEIVHTVHGGLQERHFNATSNNSPVMVPKKVSTAKYRRARTVGADHPSRKVYWSKQEDQYLRLVMDNIGMKGIENPIEKSTWIAAVYDAHTKAGYVRSRHAVRSRSQKFLNAIGLTAPSTKMVIDLVSEEDEEDEARSLAIASKRGHLSLGQDHESLHAGQGEAIDHDSIHNNKRTPTKKPDPVSKSTLSRFDANSIAESIKEIEQKVASRREEKRIRDEEYDKEMEELESTKVAMQKTIEYFSRLHI